MILMYLARLRMLYLIVCFFNNNDLSYKIIIINLSIAFIFLIISSLNFSRREAI